MHESGTSVAHWSQISDEKEKYAAYLCSREWSERKEAVRKRSDGLCERCKRNPMNAVHHKTYIRKYREPIEDLQAICNPCHEFTHGKSDFDPAADYPEGDTCSLLDVDNAGFALCPLCQQEGQKNNAIHISGVRVVQGYQCTEISREKTVCQTRDRPDGNGSRVEVFFHCESNHRFIVYFAFYKGVTEATSCESDDTSEVASGELWRS